jgi:hypothetical protein
MIVKQVFGQGGNESDQLFGVFVSFSRSLEAQLKSYCPKSSDFDLDYDAETWCERSHL